MVNWKTSLFGIIAALPQIANAIEPVIPRKYAALVTAIFTSIALMFAADIKALSLEKQLAIVKIDKADELTKIDAAISVSDAKIAVLDKNKEGIKEEIRKSE